MLSFVFGGTIGIYLTSNSIETVADPELVETVDSLVIELHSANEIILRDSVVIEEFKQDHYEKIDSIKSRSISELYSIWSNGERLDSLHEAP